MVFHNVNYESKMRSVLSATKLDSESQGGTSRAVLVRQCQAFSNSVFNWKNDHSRMDLKQGLKLKTTLVLSSFQGQVSAEGRFRPLR